MKKWLCAVVVSMGLAWGAQDKLPVVAVFEFRTDNVDSSLGRSFTQRLQGEIQKLGKYSLVDRTQMETILQEQGFQNSGACGNSECQVQMGQLVGADLLAQGSLAKVGDLFTVTVNLVDVETGRILRSASRDEKGGIEDLFAEGLAGIAKDIGSDGKKEVGQSSSNLGWWIGGGLLAVAAVGTTVFLVTAEPDSKTKITNKTLETEINVNR